MNCKTLTMTALAKYLGRSRKTMYNMIRDNRFPVAPIKGSHPRLWSKDQVDAWLAQSESSTNVTDDARL